MTISGAPELTLSSSNLLTGARLRWFTVKIGIYSSLQPLRTALDALPEVCLGRPACFEPWNDNARPLRVVWAHSLLPL